MNIQIGENNDEYNHQLHEYMVDEIDRKLNPHKYEPKIEQVEESGMMSLIIAFIIVVILFMILY